MRPLESNHRHGLSQKDPLNFNGTIQLGSFASKRFNLWRHDETKGDDALKTVNLDFDGFITLHQISSPEQIGWSVASS
jgi:hypothetical protein